jgi:ribonuclease HII
MHESNTEKNAKEEEQLAWIPYTCEPKADQTNILAAAASIVAKTYRDNMVREKCAQYPELDVKYGFLNNKAYGTKHHLQGLELHGPCVFHRRSFAPVAKKTVVQDF